MNAKVILGAALVFLLCAAVAFADSRELRIAPADGAPRAILEVGPGETVSLAADVWIASRDCPAATGCAQHVTPGEILWSADDRPQGICDLYSASVCNEETAFRPTSSGVQYEVSGSFSRPVTVVARLRGGDIMGSIQLVPRAVPPPSTVTIVDRPAPAPNVVVLQEPGHWVIVNGISYWEPHPHHSHHWYAPHYWQHPVPLVRIGPVYRDRGWHHRR